MWAADRFVLGSAAMAHNLGVSPLLIGLTVVGFGTSAPEMIVSSMAAGAGSPELSVGNALGSNIANIGMVLGASALVAPMSVRGTVLKRELPILIGCMLLATVLVLDAELGMMDGVVLAVALFGLMAWIVRVGLRGEGGDEAESELPDPISSGRALFWILVGLTLLLGSSRLLVWGASELARAAGVGPLVIGLSVVAIGTSLPELAASVVAAKRGEHDLAVGNVIGSNMFNTLGVLSLPGLIAPHEVPTLVLRRDLPVMFGITFLLFAMTRFFLRPSHLSRAEGALLVLAFVGYLALVFATET